jgi:hypothetical protein
LSVSAQPRRARGQTFDGETRRRLSAVAPIETTFELPLIHRSVTARIAETSSHFVWLFFPDGRVGWLEPDTMRILWFGDTSDLGPTATKQFRDRLP